jgi:ribose transport system permease protein
MGSGKRSFNTMFASNTFRLGLMVLTLYVISGIINPVYFGSMHIMQMLILSSFLGIIAIGQTFIILTGGIDLSVAYSITLTACVFGQTIKSTGNELLAFGAAFVAAVLAGMFKGAGVAFLKFPPMVMTLAASAVLMSVTFLYTNGVLEGGATKFISAMVKDSFLGVRYCVIIWIALSILAIFILKKTKFGREIYAVGSNARVAELAGINIKLTLMMVYVFATVMEGVAAILLIGYVGYPNYTMGDDYQLISIACVVIGGTSILGGQGGYGGTMAGVVVIYLIQSILILLEIGEAGREICYGVILVAILLLYGRGKNEFGGGKHRKTRLSQPTKEALES